MLIFGSEYLTENLLPEPRVTLFVAEFTKNLSGLRYQLASTGFNFPHIVDIEWRADYALKTDTLEKANTPTFFVKLKTMDNGEMGQVQFTCSLEQLQVLVDRLKDATASLERLDMYQSD